MTVFAYYTPQKASPVNDKRAGTIRVGSDSPTPIQVMKGWDSILHFAFRDMKQKAFLLPGRDVTAYLFNQENTQLYSAALIIDPISDGSGRLVLSKSVTDPLEGGLYNLIITYTDDFGNVIPAQTVRSQARFVIELVDFITPSPNI